MVSFHDPDFPNKLINAYEKDGYCVVSDVFQAGECRAWFEAILKFFVDMGTGINLNDIDRTWITRNLPPQTRPGLFQSLVSNIPAVWDIRSDDRVRAIFTILYSHFRDRPITDFIVSNDAVNVHPNTGQKRLVPDWAHVDQTNGDTYQCVQGQAVLTNTTACFRATPGSHLLFDKVMKLENIAHNETSNWHMVKNSKHLFTQWQLPILATQGSFIVWSSTTIHSAMHAEHKEPVSVEDPWLGWRGVVYVCYRPREEFTPAELANRASVVADNRVTNHWGTKIFRTRPGIRTVYHPKIEAYLANPKLLYKTSPLRLTESQKKLAGLC